MAEITEFSPMGQLDIAGLQDGFRGELLRPEDTGYEDDRQVWNGSIDRCPALIARCAGVADVMAAVSSRRPLASRSPFAAADTASRASRFVTTAS